MKRWLAIVRHDLLKHALWCARDLEACSAPTPEDYRRWATQLLALPGSDGTPCTASQRFAELAAVFSPEPQHLAQWTAARTEFAAALGRAEKALAELVTESAPVPKPEHVSAALALVLALDPAWQTLRRRLTEG